MRSALELRAYPIRTGDNLSLGRVVIAGGRRFAASNGPTLSEALGDERSGCRSSAGPHRPLGRSQFRKPAFHPKASEAGRDGSQIRLLAEILAPRLARTPGWPRCARALLSLFGPATLDSINRGKEPPSLQLLAGRRLLFLLPSGRTSLGEKETALVGRAVDHGVIYGRRESSRNAGREQAQRRGHQSDRRGGGGVPAGCGHARRRRVQ